jgi:hypothetical protein
MSLLPVQNIGHDRNQWRMLFGLLIILDAEKLIAITGKDQRRFDRILKNKLEACHLSFVCQFDRMKVYCHRSQDLRQRSL